MITTDERTLIGHEALLRFDCHIVSFRPEPQRSPLYAINVKLVRR